MKINIHSLRDGISVYDFETNKIDLDLVHDNYPVGLIAVEGKVNKVDHQNIFVSIKFRAPVSFICDNCLEAFERNIDEEFTLLYTRDSETPIMDDEEVVHFLSANTQEIDLTTGIREGLTLAIPMRVLCSDGCKGICPGCGVNLNEERCTCKHESMDPRWEGLKKLLNEDSRV